MDEISRKILGYAEDRFFCGPPGSPGAIWYRHYTPEQVHERIGAGWKPLWLSYESLDGAVPTPSRVPILYGWRRKVENDT